MSTRPATSVTCGWAEAVSATLESAHKKTVDANQPTDRPTHTTSYRVAGKRVGKEIEDLSVPHTPEIETGTDTKLEELR